MKLRISKEWLMQDLRPEEPEAEFSAGSFVLDSFEGPEASQSDLKEAFGTLLYVWRQEKCLSIEKLAEQADVDEEEIQHIEQDETYRPEVRTVCAIAAMMKVPNIKLLQLSGNVTPTDTSLTAKSLAFAANAKRWKHVSKEERKLLYAYLKFLSRQ